MRSFPLAVLLIVCLVPAASAQGSCGVIDTTGATIEAAPTVTTGTVTIDPCAVGGSPPDIPELGTIGTIGTMTGSLPANPDVGTGSDGAFHATADVTLPGGTYNYTSYDVDAGATVTYTGAVTILATEDVRIEGRVAAPNAGSTVTIRCAWGFSMQGGATEAVLEVQGAGSHVDVLTVGIIQITNTSRVSSEMGDVSIACLGVAGTAPALLLERANVVADEGSVTILARADVAVDASSASSPNGGLLVQSFEGQVHGYDESTLSVGGGGELTVEGQTVRIRDGSTVTAGASPIRLVAFGGDLRIEDYATVSGEDDVRCLASGSVVLLERVEVQSDGGDTILRAFGGDVSVESEGPGPWGSSLVRSHDGVTDLRASATVTLGGGTSIRSNYGDITIRALGGDVVLHDQATVGETYDRDATVDIRAHDAISATIPVHSSGSGHIRGGILLLSAGDGGIHVRQNRMFAISYDPGTSIRILSTGPIRIEREVMSMVDILISSRDDVDVSDAHIHSDSTEGPSGAITIESWAGAAGRIDARDATVRSGAGEPSGDVSLLVRTPGSSAVPPGTVESYFLPKKVRVKVRDDKPEKSKLTASGYYDMGPDDVDLTRGATLTIGGEVVSVTGLVRKGKSYAYDAPGIRFRIKPNTKGSSRARFKLKWTGSPVANLDPEDDVQIRYECGDTDGTGGCALTSGKYKIRKVRGALIEPNLYLAKIKGKIKGPGKDKLKLALGLATGGTTPAAASDVRIRFGSAVDVTIPAGSFRREGDRYVFEGNVGGIRDVVLDYAREILTIKWKELDLGGIAEGASAVYVGVDVGGDGRGVHVRLVREGSKLRY
jgi:hypothetical protein